MKKPMSLKKFLAGYLKRHMLPMTESEIIEAMRIRKTYEESAADGMRPDA